MAELFPKSFDTQLITLGQIEKKKTQGYRPSVFFDDEMGDAPRDGRYRLKSAGGIEAWRQWCINCVETTRYASPYYSTDFGIEVEKILNATSHDLAESLLQKEIMEALEADPYKRMSYLKKIDFNWIAPDAVEVTVCAVGIDGSTIDFPAQISKERG